MIVFIRSLVSVPFILAAVGALVIAVAGPLEGVNMMPSEALMGFVVYVVIATALNWPHLVKRVTKKPLQPEPVIIHRHSEAPTTSPVVTAKCAHCGSSDVEITRL